MIKLLKDLWKDAQDSINEIVYGDLSRMECRYLEDGILPEQPRQGVLYIIEKKNAFYQYIYNGIEYELIDKKFNDIPINEVENEHKIIIQTPKICKCCGAALHSNICAYCGVEYN